MPSLHPESSSTIRQRRIHQSPNYRHGAFQNEAPTTLMLAGKAWKAFNAVLHKPSSTVPKSPLPTLHTDLQHLPDDQPVIVWFGHSSYLMQYRGLCILVDPLLQSNASPVAFFGKPFPGTDKFQVNDLPDIDLLIITHNHYDHLSYHTLKNLHLRVKHICTSLGVGKDLEKWGVPPEKITELDWNESHVVNTEVQLTAVTARHFSGRTFRRNQSLWSAFVLKWGKYNLFLGGDSGYGNHFAAIGRQYGPFDMVVLECGQYGDYWPQIHMRPEETAQAAVDLQAKLLLPVHWAKFTLSVHPWFEPPERLLASPAANGLAIATPRIGQPFQLGEVLPQEKWWEEVPH
jgi:L-ascorbate metabolism protein UlaG (beta-lactamase superfamily)